MPGPQRREPPRRRGPAGGDGTPAGPRREKPPTSADRAGSPNARGGAPRGAGHGRGSAGRPAAGRGTRPATGGGSAAARPPARERIEPLEDAEPHELDPQSRRQLRSLAKDNADRVARHLVSAGRLLDSDPDAALRQAQAARSLAGRVGVVREAAGLAAYAAGQWQEAITELRAAARLGAEDHLAVMADSERGLGRPERALELGRSARAAALGPAERAELLIVLSGARRDLGQLEAAVVTLAGPDLDRRVVQPWTARLWYAYAEALLAAGRTDEAVDWFAATAGIDDGETDAEERVLSLTGVDIDEQPDAAD